MAHFNQTGRFHSGGKLTATGATPVALTDTMTINGTKLTIQEWIRRGVLRTVSVVGNVNSYYVENTPDHAGGF